MKRTINKSFAATIAVAVITILLTACSSKSNILGTWEETSGQITDARWVFYEDNTFMLEPQLSVLKGKTIGTYEVKGHTIYFKISGGKEETMHFERNGNHLKLGTDAGGYYELTKVN